MTGVVDGIPVKLVTMISATTISNHCEFSQTIALLSAPRPDLPRFRLSAQSRFAGETHLVPGPLTPRTNQRLSETSVCHPRLLELMTDLAPQPIGRPVGVGPVAKSSNRLRLVLPSGCLNRITVP